MDINSFWKNIKNKKGITLVELLIAMAIAAMVVAVAVSMLLFVYTVFNKGEAQYDVQSKNRLASDYIQKQVRYASDLYLPSTQPNPSEIIKFDLEFAERIYINGSNQLVHDKWDKDSSTFKTVFTTQSQIAGSNFELRNNKLLIKLSPSSDYPLSSEIILPNLLPTNTSYNAQQYIVFTRDISSAGLAAVLENITFDTNGGIPSFIAPISKAAGSLVTAPANPTREGHTFTGWNPPFPADGRMPEGGLSLTATWDAVKYTVTFNANGGTPSTSSNLVTFGFPYGTLPTVTRTDFTLNGWFTAATGGTQVTSGTAVSIASNHTLFAQWTPVLQITNIPTSAQKNKTFSYTPTAVGGSGSPYLFYYTNVSGWQPTPAPSYPGATFSALTPKTAGDKAYFTIRVTDKDLNSRTYNVVITAD